MSENNTMKHTSVEKNNRVNATLTMIDSVNNGVDLEQLLRMVKKPKRISEIIMSYIGDMSISMLADFAGCSRNTIYKILDGRMHPEQDLIIRIAVILKVDIHDTQAMLKDARRATLSAQNVRDACIIYGIMNQLGPEEIDEVLEKKNCPPLWSQE